MSKNKDRDPNEYYKETETNDARLHRLIALRLRNAMLLNAYYNKGRPDESGGEWGLFDIVDPSEEADALVQDLRFFELIPPAHSGEGCAE